MSEFKFGMLDMMDIAFFLVNRTQAEITVKFRKKIGTPRLFTITILKIEQLSYASKRC